MNFLLTERIEGTVNKGLFISTQCSFSHHNNSEAIIQKYFVIMATYFHTIEELL